MFMKRYYGKLAQRLSTVDWLRLCPLACILGSGGGIRVGCPDGACRLSLVMLKVEDDCARCGGGGCGDEGGASAGRAWRAGDDVGGCDCGCGDGLLRMPGKCTTIGAAADDEAVRRWAPSLRLSWFMPSVGGPSGGEGLPKSLGDEPANGLKVGTAIGALTGCDMGGGTAITAARAWAERGGWKGATCVRLNAGTACGPRVSARERQ